MVLTRTESDSFVSFLLYDKYRIYIEEAVRVKINSIAQEENQSRNKSWETMSYIRRTAR